MTPKGTAIDLFAGAGGFTAGACAAGLDVLFALNHWHLAIEAHKLNHPTTFTGKKLLHEKEDALRYDWSKAPLTDFILASPACQGFSKAATHGLKGKARNTAAIHDKIRATPLSVPVCVEYMVARAEEERRSKPILVVENVPEFATAWPFFPHWIGMLESVGYAVSKHVIDAADLGVPQSRKRLFIVGLPDAKRPFDLKVPKVARPTPFQVCMRPSERWLPLSEWDDRMVVKMKARRDWFARNGKKVPAVWLWQNSDGTAKPTDPSFEPIRTVTAKALGQWYAVRGDYMRGVSVEEFRCAMGFPDDYQLPKQVTHAGKMLGNAVCPPVSEFLISELLRRA